MEAYLEIKIQDKDFSQDNNNQLTLVAVFLEEPISSLSNKKVFSEHLRIKILQLREEEQDSLASQLKILLDK